MRCVRAFITAAHLFLTGLRPFHRLGHYAVVVAVQKRERPGKPLNAESLGSGVRRTVAVGKFNIVLG
jgi:hypothetical protein